MMSDSDEEEFPLLLALSFKRKRRRWWCTKSLRRGNALHASAFFTRFLYSKWPVSYKNT